MNLNKVEASNAGIYSWYLRDSQFEIYSFIHRSIDPFIECARRFGKTTTVLVYCLEQLRNNPGFVVRWIEPWKNQCREIVQPEIDKIQSETNEELKGVYVGTDSFYRFPNGSRLYLRGINEDAGKSARGSFANIIVADEFGFWSYPEIVESVLQPQLLTTRGKLMIMSTPPDDLGHSYYDRKSTAIKEGRFIQKTIYDNESLTPLEIEKEMAKHGGANSPSWQREYLCLPVSNPERLVIPEFKESSHVYINADRPTHFDTYVAIDLGFNDKTVALFAYYNFEEGHIYIEREHAVNAQNSKEITDECKKIELDIWGKKPTLRVADNDKQQLFDMLTMCDYSVVPTRKDDKMAAINAVRLAFTNGRIKIHSSCVNLIFQLTVGIWNVQRTGFLRGDRTGHLDAIDALIYLVRNIDQNKNPFPPMLGLSHQTHMIPKTLQNSKESETLRSIFNIKR